MISLIGTAGHLTYDNQVYLKGERRQWQCSGRGATNHRQPMKINHQIWRAGRFVMLTSTSLVTCLKIFLTNALNDIHAHVILLSCDLLPVEDV